MWKVFWYAAAAVGLMALFVAWSGATTTFLYKHPRAEGVRVVIDKRTGGAVVEAIASPEKAAPAPRVSVPHTTHEFGRMDPSSSASRAFQITNAGRAPLKLALGPTSCKCTLSGLDKKELQPGETANVKLEWNTGRTKERHFAQSAMVLTNDPLRKEIEFVVQGDVKMLAGLDVESIALPPLSPDKQATAEFLVYSQMWPDLTVQSVGGNLPNLEWTAETVEPAQLPDLQMLSIQRVRIEFDRPKESSSFEEELLVKVAPAAGGDAVDLYLPIRGSSIRRLAFYGPAIDENGMVDLGTVPQGKGKKVRLLVKVRDEQRELPQARIEASPSFLQAEFSPHEGETEGLYDLVVELPSDAPACQYRTSPIGYIRIDTGHPRIGAIELKVTFAVLPKQPL